MYAPVHKETFYEASPMFRGGGGYYGGDGIGTGGWIAGGIAFLFLVFIIFGFAFFHRGDGDKLHDSIREHGNHNLASQLANAKFQGVTETREADMYSMIKENGEELDQIKVALAHGFDHTIGAVKESVKEIELFGSTRGFRMFDLAYHNPCDERGERRGRGDCGCGERHEKILTVPAPTGLTIGEKC